MKTRFTKLLTAVAVAAAVAPASASAAFLQDWYFCTAGGCNSTNYTTGDKISEYLDLVGPSYVQTSTVGVGGSFTFTEWGAFRIDNHDGGTPLTQPNYITSIFTGKGTATLGGSLSYAPFDGTIGYINVYSDTTNNFATSTSIYGADDGTLIAQFLLTGGTGLVDPLGLPNGFISLVGAANYLASGYFFDKNGVDLSTIVPSVPPILFGFATVNSSRVTNPAPIVVTEIVNEFAGDPSFANTLPSQNQGGEMIFANNGQFRLVPEPGSLALLGLGFAGMGWLARRRKGQQ